MAGEFIGLDIPQEVNRGDRFGTRTIICETTKRRNGRRFSVKCDCGNIQTIDLHRLKKIAAGTVGQKCRRCRSAK